MDANTMKKPYNSPTIAVTSHKKKQRKNVNSLAAHSNCVEKFLQHLKLLFKSIGHSNSLPQHHHFHQEVIPIFQMRPATMYKVN